MKKRIIGIIILVCLFIVNTILVVTGNTTSFDDAVHTFIRGCECNVVDTIMNTFTFLGSTLFIIVLSVLVGVYFIFKKKYDNTKVVAFSIITSTLLNNIIKFIVRRARPLYITVVETTYSYPSGHTMASITLYGIFMYLLLKSNLNKIIKVSGSTLLGILMIMIPVSRIYLGAHFITDILGGIMCSSIVIIVTTMLNDKYFSKKVN